MSFLQEYGESDRRYERIGRGLVVVLLAALFLGLIYYIFFRNWREERQVRRFLSSLQEQNYDQAYAYWGCSKEEPCTYYPYDRFLEDWGPQSRLGKVSRFSLGRSYTQQNGVIVTVQINGQPRDNLWVDQKSHDVSFSPY